MHTYHWLKLNSFYLLLFIFSGVHWSIFCQPTRAATLQPDHQFTHSSSDFGGIGLMQTPSARFAPDGEMLAGMSAVSPYNRYFISMQALPGLEATLRYSEITNRLYGDVEFSGSQTYKDKSFDAKFLLLKEGPKVPQVAVGIRDFGGTGLFSSEYVVANRRWYNWDFSFGIGWGYMGSRANTSNPIALFSDSFNSRVNDVGQGGTLGYKSWFHGKDTSLFGGVEYQTPVNGLRVKVEFDGNNYQNEPFNNAQKVDSPVNIGTSYQLFDWLDLSMALERGNTLMLSAVARTNFHDAHKMPKFDPPPQALQKRYKQQSDKTGRNTKEHWAGDHLFKALSDEGFAAQAVAVNGSNVTLFASQKKYNEQPRAIGRAARIIFNAFPQTAGQLTYVNLEGGLETNRYTFKRNDFEKAINHLGSSEEIWNNGQYSGSEIGVIPDGAIINSKRYPAFTWNWGPKLRQHIGGPDKFYFWQLWARFGGKVELSRGLSLQGSVGFDIYNNFDALKLESNSKLPHVRSEIKNYLKEGRSNLVNLKLDYVKNLAPNLFGRLSGGIFEEMYGGVEGEILYRPYLKRWAVSANLNWVKQRDFDQRFTFRDYSTTTGHMTLYCKLPFWDILSEVSTGRYLAKDKGVSFAFSRRFKSGIKMGVFFTFTDVSKEEFGEGSFDKGIHLSIPLDYLLTRSSRGRANFGWRPLTRDGGQKVSAGNQLYDLVGETDHSSMSRDWSRIVD